MRSYLKSHPFAVQAHFEHSLVLTYALPKEQLEQFIPECLSLDTFQDKWAFVAIAMVKTSALRPKGFPKLLGQDFFLIGYRIFVRYMDKRGKRLRGLFILQSETDSLRMKTAGNIFTHYNYEQTDISFQASDDRMTVESKKSKFKVIANLSEDPPLPDGSCFDNWAEARKFAGPLPHTFTYDADKQEVLIIRGLRQNWKPRPVEVEKAAQAFFQQLNLPDAQLANAFLVSNIPYEWGKGKTEKWQG